MPKGGVKELIKSSDGRRYLAKLQHAYHNDIVQQSSEPELFQKLYGKKIAQQQSDREKKEARAQAEWKTIHDKREYEKNRGKKRIFV